MISISMADYEIYLESNIIYHLPEYLRKIYHRRGLFVVTDRHVYDLYHLKLAHILSEYQVQFVVIEPGEKSKSFEVYRNVIDTLIEKGIKRTDLILSFGGGVVGDLAGFVAATLYRGIPYVQIPTTLLAQVDSSIGGKVGIDLPSGKNLVGAFYPPKLVIIDPELLHTLSEREYRNGLAEMIKAGLIGDKKLYQYLLVQEKVREQDIASAIHVKREVVLSDPYDHGERMKLNFGHTFGHAIEKKHHYETYLHGEAISYGMLIALEIGVLMNETKPELYDEVKTLLLDRKLIHEPLLLKEDYKDHIMHDKKMTDEGLKFILVTKPGEAKIVNLKPEDLL